MADKYFVYAATARQRLLHEHGQQKSMNSRHDIPMCTSSICFSCYDTNDEYQVVKKRDRFVSRYIPPMRIRLATMVSMFHRIFTSSSMVRPKKGAISGIGEQNKE